ncbi:MAG: universal stress protein [Thermoplasmata archaeon]
MTEAALFPTITVAVDGSANAAEAVDVAIDLAKRYGSRLTILTVAPTPAVYLTPGEPWVVPEGAESELPSYQSLVDTFAAKARDQGVSSVRAVAVEGVVVDEVLGFQEREPSSLFVVGSRGLSRTRRILLGSVSTAVVQSVKNAAVLIVHPSGGATKPSS